MTTYTNTTRVTSTTTPSQFSLKYFEKILMHMQRTIYFDEEMRHMPHHDPVEVACAGEAPADAWVATEEAAFAFLRAHSGATAVPLLTETAKHLVSLLDIETEDHPTLSETMEYAIARRSKAAPVIPPFLAGYDRRIHAAIFSFIAGVMPPMPIFGRSLL